MMAFFAGGLLFYILGSEYNAIIQVAVYGLAVPIIIALSLLFIDSRTYNYQNKSLPLTTIFFGGIFSLAFIYLGIISLKINPNTFHIVEFSQITSSDVISAFVKGIFINYVLAFELLSLLFVIIIVGISLLRRNR
jgi:NADH:ubiquinone oxidoreductase subunit 6 (subunit J)